MNAQILTTKHITNTVTNKTVLPFLRAFPLSFPHIHLMVTNLFNHRKGWNSRSHVCITNMQNFDILKKAAWISHKLDNSCKDDWEHNSLTEFIWLKCFMSFVQSICNCTVKNYKFSTASTYLWNYIQQMYLVHVHYSSISNVDVLVSPKQITGFLSYFEVVGGGDAILVSGSRQLQ